MVSTLAPSSAATQIFEWLGTLGSSPDLPTLEQTVAQYNSIGLDGMLNLIVTMQPEVASRIPNGLSLDFGNGYTLDDGTVLSTFRAQGEVAINAGQSGDRVAFHGRTGRDKAVFTQAGLVAKVGDTLPDGTPLDEIEVNGGVAINVFGEVAFHGRTGGVKVVFISDGQTIQVVAKVGDNVDDGTTLSEINNTAGVAITPYGSEVAFHGKVGTTDAVFVGSAPPPTPAVGASNL